MSTEQQGNMEHISESLDQISELMSTVGEILSASPNESIRRLGNSILSISTTGTIASEIIKLQELVGGDYEDVLYNAGETAAEMLGAATGVALLESMITANLTASLTLGAVASRFPVAGTLLLGSMAVGSAKLGEVAAQQGYSNLYSTLHALNQMSEDPLGATTGSGAIGSGVIELDPTYIFAELEDIGGDTLAGRDQLDFARSFDKEVSSYNDSLSTLFAAPYDYLYRDDLGILQFNSSFDVGSSFWDGVNPELLNNSALSRRINDFLENANRMIEFAESSGNEINSFTGNPDASENLARQAASAFQSVDEGTAEMTPLVLDISGNGIKTLSMADATNGFEFEDGVRDAKHGWIKGDSAFLAIDLNGNGKIDNYKELFGSPTEDGFTVLSKFDSNNDGVINKHDDKFSELLIWQDRNENSITDDHELFSLADHALEISLDTIKTFRHDNGNSIRIISSYLDINGESREIADVYFDYSKPANTSLPTDFNITASIENQTTLLIQSLATLDAADSSSDSLIIDQNSTLTNINIASPQP